jgi:hypothetical protein
MGNVLIAYVGIGGIGGVGGKVRYEEHFVAWMSFPSAEGVSTF